MIQGFNHNTIDMEYENLTDHFLIAMPGLDDPNFHKTVTYICAHNEEGAMGIIINRPSELILGEVLTQMDMNAESDMLNNIPVLSRWAGANG